MTRKCFRCSTEISSSCIKLQVSTQDGRAAGRPVFVCSYLCGSSVLLSDELPTPKALRPLVPERAGAES